MKTPEVGDVIQERSTGIYFRVHRFIKPKRYVKVMLVPLDEEYHSGTERHLNYLLQRFVPFEGTEYHQRMLVLTAYLGANVLIVGIVNTRPMIAGILPALLGCCIIYLTHLLLLWLWKKGLLNYKRYTERRFPW